MPPPIAPGTVSTGLSRRALFQSPPLVPSALPRPPASRWSPPQLDTTHMRWRHRFQRSCLPTMGWRGRRRISRSFRTLRAGSIARSYSAGAVNTMSAWYCGFLHGLYEQKVNLDIAEMVVGTSAGTDAGLLRYIGPFQALAASLRLFWRIPAPVRQVGPVTSPNLSQKRAQEINFNVKDGSPASDWDHRACGLGCGQPFER